MPEALGFNQHSHWGALVLSSTCCIQRRTLLRVAVISSSGQQRIILQRTTMEPCECEWAAGTTLHCKAGVVQHSCCSQVQCKLLVAMTIPVQPACRYG